jgi:DNA-binding NarL/FixJ family response regulator
MVTAAVPVPALGPSFTLDVAVVGDEGDWPHGDLLSRDDGIRLRHVSSPYGELLDGPCHLVLVRGAEAARDVSRYLAPLGTDAPPLLLVCSVDGLREIGDVFRLGVTSCLVEGDYDGWTLMHALWTTAQRHTLVSPTVRALCRDLAPAAAHPAAPAARQERLRGTLSPRERQVMDLIASGLGVSEIGQRMCLTVKTVRNYLSGIYTKLGVSGRTQAVLHWLDAAPPPAAPHPTPTATRRGRGFTPSTTGTAVRRCA